MGFGLVLGIGFDLAQLAAMFDADRTRVDFPTVWGETYSYYCKPGPDGTPPERQAEQAHAALEASLLRFGEVLLEDIDKGDETGQSDLAVGLTIVRKGDSWNRSITRHLEETYGCMLVG
jgi:hypothetical protein